MDRSSRDMCHRWYRTVLAFSPELVSSYLHGRRPDHTVVLDPFAGSGTTCVEAKLRGFAAIGVDAIPFYTFVTKTKVTWTVDPVDLWETFAEIREEVVHDTQRFIAPGKKGFPRTSGGREPSVAERLGFPQVASPSYLNKRNLIEAMMFRKRIERTPKEKLRDKLLLALADAFVRTANVRFGPEISRSRHRPRLELSDLMGDKVREMAMDLQILCNVTSRHSRILTGDSRDLGSYLDRKSIDLVITSPPYPVDKDYTRQARLELALLGYVAGWDDIRQIKRSMVRSSTRQVFADDEDYALVARTKAVQEIIHRINRRVSADGDTSGFAKVYPKLVGNYFGGMYRHFETLLPLLRKGGKCIYIVGDSRSFKQVHIQTARILAILARRAGFAIRGLGVWRSRRSSGLGKPIPEYTLIFERA